MSKESKEFKLDPSKFRNPTNIVKGQDIRYYLVWLVPGNEKAVGIWSGPHPKTLSALKSTFPKGLEGVDFARESKDNLETAISEW